MNEEIDTTNHIALLLQQRWIKEEAARISLRLAHLVRQLEAIFSSSGDEWMTQQEEELDRAFKTITYTREQNSGPICWTCDEKLKYYRCFDCEINSSCCFCEKCFDGPQHAGHQFKILTSNSNNYCDCGNEEYARSEHFCKEHRGKRNEEETQERNGGDGKESSVNSKERELFGRQMEFLLFLGLEAKRKSIKANPQRAIHIALKAMQILALSLNNSYTYQRLASQLLLQPFRYHKAQKETILHLLMWQEWNSDPLNAALAKILCQLCACKKAKKSILIEYFHLHASQDQFVSCSNPLTQIDSQYFLQGNLILKLLKAKVISPLIYNYNFVNGESAASGLIQFYRAYRIMHESPTFRQILQESLAVINFSKFFSFATIDRDNRALLNQVTNYYLVFLKIIMQRLQEFKDKQAAERKIIRQCYQYIKNKEELYSFAPERTLGWVIFSHCNCDLTILSNCSLQWMMELLGEQSIEVLKEAIQKMLEGFCNIFRIENYNDYRELTSSQKSELNAHNKVIISMDYTTVRIIVTFLQILSRQGGGETAPLRNLQVAKHSLLEKWTYLFKTDKSKKEALTDPTAKAQMVTLMETGLFIKVDDQIAGTALELVGIVNNLLFACESDLCETILSNCINKAQHDKVIKLLRQFAWLHSSKTKLQFKSYAESIIFNQKIIKEFILSKDDIMRNKPEKYQSNLTYCSRYFSEEISDDTSQRFLKKLQSNRKGTTLSRFLFSDSMIARLIKFTELFIKLITTSVDLKEYTTINVTFNLLIETLAIIFAETRNEKLKKMILRINETQVLRDNYTEYTVIIIRILLDYFSQKEEAEDQVKRKEAAKLKREQKMRQIKQKQSKFLQQHCTTSNIPQKVQQNIDLCIICKSPSVQQRQLSYLCKIRFSNTLTRSVLSSNNIMMVITTCGHKIHESCLASSIDARDKYGTKYHCFLCKHISNIRIPLNLQPGNVQTFLQYFLTIISLEMSSNPSLKERTEEYSSISNLSKLLYDNIVLSIFIYYYSFSKFYSAYIMPIVWTEIGVLKWLRKSFAVPKRVDYSGKDQRIRIIQNKLNHILDAKIVVEQIGSKEESEQVDQLFLKISDPSQAPTSQIKKIHRFNFLQLPQDLRSLTKLVGKCKFCNQYNNKTMVCFQCNFKCCNDCNAQINKHIDLHLGTCILIDVENGHICYRFRSIQVQAHSLYTNYAGEEFGNQAELPPKGEFQLSQQRLEKLIDEVLKDQIQSIVEEYVRQAEVPPGCNIQ